VAFLTILSLATPTVFFICMGVTGVAALGCCFLIKEPVRIPVHGEESQQPEAIVVGTPALA
jgi:hypothetical protein